jgi:hypothetical protein
MGDQKSHDTSEKPHGFSETSRDKAHLSFGGRLIFVFIISFSEIFKVKFKFILAEPLCHLIQNEKSSHPSFRRA